MPNALCAIARRRIAAAAAAMVEMDEFPDEILLQIFGYLPIVDRIRAERVNRRWHDIMPYDYTDLDLLECILPHCLHAYSKSRDCLKCRRRQKMDTLPNSNIMRAILIRSRYTIDTTTCILCEEGYSI